jgi:hypothetical protein
MERFFYNAIYYFSKIYFVFMKALINAGNSTKFVNVLTTKVIEVNQPKALVPPKSLKQNMTKPATNTKEV